MIRELLTTVGDADVFFELRAKELHPFYDTDAVSAACFNAMLHNAVNLSTPVFSQLSYGQTRDFINAVADELGEK